MEKASAATRWEGGRREQCSIRRADAKCADAGEAGFKRLLPCVSARFRARGSFCIADAHSDKSAPAYPCLAKEGLVMPRFLMLRSQAIVAPCSETRARARSIQRVTVRVRRRLRKSCPSVSPGRNLSASVELRSVSECYRHCHCGSSHTHAFHAITLRTNQTRLAPRFAVWPGTASYYSRIAHQTLCICSERLASANIEEQHLPAPGARTTLEAPLSALNFWRDPGAIWGTRHWSVVCHGR